MNRSLPLLLEDGAKRLAGAKVAIAGCGGVGGAAAVLFARMGVGSFRLADPGYFDKPDMNRQWGAFLDTLDQPKVEVYHRQLSQIDPSLEVELFRDGITGESVVPFTENIDILIDCLDVSVPIELRMKAYALAREQGAYILSVPILGFGCVVAGSLPDQDDMSSFLRLMAYTYRTADLHPAIKQHFSPSLAQLVGSGVVKGRVPSVAVAPTLAAALAVTEAMVFLLKESLHAERRALALPHLLLVDLLQYSFVRIDVNQIAWEDTDVNA